MAEFNDYVTYGQLMAVVDRLDERILGLAQEVREMRADIRHLSGRLFTLHLALWGVGGVGFTLYKLFPNP
jgi:hypothetical protein